MNQQEKREEIFETSGAPDSKENGNLAFYKDSLVEKPEHNKLDALSTPHINPDAAFEVFNGKLFGNSRYEYSIADAMERRAENPLQRFSRLRGELDALKSDLDGMVAAEKFDASSIWAVLQKETGKLVQQTRILEEHKGLALATPSATSTDRELQKLLDNINKKPLDGGFKAASGSSSSKEGSSSLSGRGDSDLLNLEKRIAGLESFLGHASNCADHHSSASGGSGNNNNQFPILDSLARLEHRVSMLDPENLEVLRARASALRAELESTTKSKGGLTTEQKAIEAAKKVEDLFELVHKVESVAEDLPALVIRLKTLENIHLSASTFASRLATMEAEVKNVSGDLKSNKEVMISLKAGLAENISIMQQNVKMVDKKLAGK